MRTVLILCVVALFVGGVANDASAKSAKDRAWDLAEAGTKLQVEGKAAEESGDEDLAQRLYLRAIDRFEEAYEIIPHVGLTYNIAFLLHQTGDHELALDAYKEFLKRAPNKTKDDEDYVKLKQKAKKSVRTLERLIAEKEESEAEEDPEDLDPDELDPDELDPDEDPEDWESEETDPEVGISSRRPKTKAGAGKRYAGLGIAAAGAISIGLGVKFGLDAKASSDLLSNFNETMWTDEALAHQSKGETAEQRMFIFSGIGVAALIGGGLLYLSGANSPEDSSENFSLRFSPLVHPERVGFSLQSAF